MINYPSHVGMDTRLVLEAGVSPRLLKALLTWKEGEGENHDRLNW